MSVNTAERMLRVIEVLSESGSCTVLNIHRATRFSRPAIYRLLQILIQRGYARRTSDDVRFRLTPAIRELCGNVSAEDDINTIAAPVLNKFHKDVVWPLSLSVFDKGMMVIRCTTRNASPLVFDCGRIGTRLPVLETAVGLAYLAFSSTATKTAVLSCLRAGNTPRVEFAEHPGRLDGILRATMRRGYATRCGGTVPNTSSIAVPICHGGTAVGSLVVSFLSSALTLEKAAESFVPGLRVAANDIARSVDKARLSA